MKLILKINLPDNFRRADFLSFHQRDTQMLAERWDTPWLRVAYDTANALATEDPADGVRRVGRHLAIAHVSDTWRHRWAHTSPGRGEVDFPAFARALADIGFTGPTVYELVDGEDPQPRLERDLAALETAGWSRAGLDRTQEGTA